MLLDSDWIRLADQIREDWTDHLTEIVSLIGSIQKEGARLAGDVENPVNVEEAFKNTVKWLSATTNSIDNEDAKVVERVSKEHSGNGFTQGSYGSPIFILSFPRPLKSWNLRRGFIMIVMINNYKICDTHLLMMHQTPNDAT